MEKKISGGLVGLEFATPITALIFNFIIDPKLKELQFSLGSFNTSLSHYIFLGVLIFISAILLGNGVRHFKLLYSNKKLSSWDKKLGLFLITVLWLLIIYLYIFPLFNVINSIAG